MFQNPFTAAAEVGALHFTRKAIMFVSGVLRKKSGAATQLKPDPL